MRSCSSSGSSCPESPVDPTKSQNITVTWRRSPFDTPCGSPCSAWKSVPVARFVLASSCRAPLQSPQNFLSAGFSEPHFGQQLASCAPQSPQNSLLDGFSAPHFEQRISPIPLRDPWPYGC